MDHSTLCRNRITGYTSNVRTVAVYRRISLALDGTESRWLAEALHRLDPAHLASEDQFAAWAGLAENS